MADLLIVEDDYDLAELMVELLQLAGHRVRQARNGAEGMALLDARLPDAVICDVEMPQVDGPAMVLRMGLADFGKERLPVVLTSGVEGLQRVAEQVGTPYYLSKPYDLDELLALLERVLTERRAPDPHAAGHGGTS